MTHNLWVIYIIIYLNEANYGTFVKEKMYFGCENENKSEVNVKLVQNISGINYSTNFIQSLQHECQKYHTQLGKQWIYNLYSITYIYNIVYNIDYII